MGSGGDGVDMRPGGLKALGEGVNQQYGNMKPPDDAYIGGNFHDTIPESMQLSLDALGAAANIPMYVLGFSGTMGYNASLMKLAAEHFHDMDANSGARYNEIMGGLQNVIPDLPASGSGNGYAPHPAVPTPDTHAPEGLNLGKLPEYHNNGI